MLMYLISRQKIQTTKLLIPHNILVTNFNHESNEKKKRSRSDYSWCKENCTGINIRHHSFEPY